MPRIAPVDELRRTPFILDEAKQKLVRHLLKAEGNSPLLCLETLGNKRTQLTTLDTKERPKEIYEEHLLTAMERLAGSDAHGKHPNVFIELFDGLTKRDRAHQAQAWNISHETVGWPIPAERPTWGPLIAAISAMELGAERAVIHLSCVYLTSPDFSAARRKLLEQKLVAGVVFTKLPLSTSSVERDCYLVISKNSDAVSFYEVSGPSQNATDGLVRKFALLRNQDLLHAPEAGLSLFDAKVAESKLIGRKTLSDIAQVLSSAGSAIRRSGGLSEDASLPARYISIVDFDHGVLRPQGKYFKPGESFNMRKYQLKSGDILVARNATAGGIQFVPFDPAAQSTPLVASENVLVLRLKDATIHPYALYIYLAFGEGKTLIEDCRVSTPLGSISPKRLLDIPAPVVSDVSNRHILELYSEYLETINAYEEVLLDITAHESKAKQVATIMDFQAWGLPLERLSSSGQRVRDQTSD